MPIKFIEFVPHSKWFERHSALCMGRFKKRFGSSLFQSIEDLCAQSKKLNNGQFFSERSFASRVSLDPRFKDLDLLFFKNAPIMNTYFADFVCESRGLVVEIDGSSHAGKRDNDIVRDSHFEHAGYKTVRISYPSWKGYEEFCSLMLRKKLPPPIAHQMDRHSRRKKLKAKHREIRDARHRLQNAAQSKIQAFKIHNSKLWAGSAKKKSISRNTWGDGKVVSIEYD